MSVDSAFALPDLSTAASHAGAMMTAGALSNPAETKSRRVTGRLWFSCRSGSPRARGRAGFLRMNMGGSSLSPLLQSHRGPGGPGPARRLGTLGHGWRGPPRRDSGGSDCCSELYSVEAVGFVIGTPVMADMERFTLSKVAMPKSGRGVLSAVIGGLLIVGPTKGCKLEPSWSNERKKMSLSAPLSAAITAPTFDSS